MTPAAEKITRNQWLALGAMALGVFVIANDFTALSVAIPRIEADLHTSINRAQWVINGYALVFGVLIVTGGRLADLFGRRRMFLVGASIFGFFSLLSGIMPTVDLLIVFRALMGVGGAIVWPAALGLTYMILPASKKGLAGGLILGVAGLGNAVGPLLGGWLTDVATWRVVFFINLPITLFAMFVTAREVPESATQSAERSIDYPGIALLSAGAVALLLALDLGTDGGFGRPLIIGLIAAGVIMLVLFFLIERREGGKALVAGGRHAQQRVLGGVPDRPVHVGDLFLGSALPAAVHGEGPYVLRAPLRGRSTAVDDHLRGHVVWAGWLYGRLGPKVVVTAGTACLATGIFLLSWLTAGSSYASLVPGMVVLGVGVGLFYSSVTTAAVTALDPSQSSLAGGIVYMCQVAGGAIGLGLNTAIVLSAATLPAGIRVAFRVDAALGIVGTVVSLWFVHGPKRSAAHAASSHAHHRIRL